jgi:hypothetical protein
MQSCLQPTSSPPSHPPLFSFHPRPLKYRRSWETPVGGGEQPEYPACPALPCLPIQHKKHAPHARPPRETHFLTHYTTVYLTPHGQRKKKEDHSLYSLIPLILPSNVIVHHLPSLLLLLLLRLWLLLLRLLLLLWLALLIPVLQGARPQLGPVLTAFFATIVVIGIRIISIIHR